MKQKKNKFKENLGKRLKEIVITATNNLSLFEGLISFVVAVLAVMLFAFGWTGIVDNLFETYFELLVIACLMFLVLQQVRIRLNNGIIGISVFIYFALGIMAVLSREFTLINLGFNVVKVALYLTVVCLAYKFLDEGGLIDKWRLKFLK